MDQKNSSTQKNHQPQPVPKAPIETHNITKPDRPTGGSFADPTLPRRALMNPAGLKQGDLVPLQRVIGNRAAQRLLETRTAGLVQRKDTGPTPAEAEKKMVEALQTSARGQKALAIWKKRQVTLNWVDTGAAGYSEQHNTCVINRMMDPKEAAGYFVHEMHHANEFISGRSPAAKDYDDSQEKVYIKRMVDEEITGIYLQYEAMLEMGTVPASQNKITELFPQYKRVRRHWADEHLKKDPKDQEGAVKAGQAQAYALVNYWVTGGPGKNWPTLAPSQLETYEMYYRRMFRESRTGGGSGGGHSH